MRSGGVPSSSIKPATPGPTINLVATCLVVTETVDDVVALDEPGLLSAAELARRNAIRTTRAEQGFVAGAVLLRLVVARLTGRSPADVPVVRQCPDCGFYHGKPRVGVDGLHVSVSHADDESVQIAVTQAGPVGVDIEARGRRVTDAMRHMLARASGPLRTADEFLTTWTRVEAVVKATGEGLRVPLDQVLVSLPGDPPALKSYRGAHLPCQLHGQRPRPHLVGAVAVLSERRVEVFHISGSDFLAGQPDQWSASTR